MYICCAVFMLLKMTSTIGISHYHLYIVLSKRGGSMGCYIATDKPYITPINILFYLNNWRTRLFTENSIAVSDSANGFFLRFLLSLAFLGLLGYSLGLLDAWGWVVQQYLQTMQWWKSLRAEPYNITHEHELPHELPHDLRGI